LTPTENPDEAKMVTRSTRLDVVVSQLGLDEPGIKAYEKLFVHARSPYSPIRFPAWESLEGSGGAERSPRTRSAPGEDPVLCGRCQDQFAAIGLHRRQPVHRTFRCECGAWWKATRHRPDDILSLRRREYRWTTASIYTHGDRDHYPRVSGADLANHLSWDIGRHFRVVSLRPQDSRFLPSDLHYGGSSWLALDFDFKSAGIWSREESDRYAEEVEAGRLYEFRLEEILADYESAYVEFVGHVKRVLAALPAVSLAFRSSWSHGIHAYWFLDREHPSEAICARVRGLLDKAGLLDTPGLDERIHPDASSGLRLPLGLGSKLLNPRTLRPMFEGDTSKSQVGPAFKWLSKNLSKLPRYRLGDFGKQDLAYKPKEVNPSFRLRIWSEGILAPGTRRRRTKQVILLGLFAGFYGEELDAFVHNWISTKHNRRSNDVNSALRRCDRALNAIRAENRLLIESLRHLGPVQEASAPLPLGLLRTIIKKVMSVRRLNKRERYVTIAFAAKMHALVDLLLWRAGNHGATGRSRRSSGDGFTLGTGVSARDADSSEYSSESRRRPTIPPSPERALQVPGASHCLSGKLTARP
jgi:hypothetical protein